MRFIASTAFILLLGCTQKLPEAAWNYQPAHGAYKASLSYDFADSEGTIFIGICEGGPSFMMAGGNWQLRADQFTLTVDGHSWDLPTVQSVHGHYLPVDRQGPEEAIASAKRLIVFRVGSWHREIRPAAPLTSFVTDCS